MKAAAFYSQAGKAFQYYKKYTILNNPAKRISDLLALNGNPDLHKGCLVDFGSGPGTSIETLLLFYHFSQCYAVDVSLQMIEFLQNSFKNNEMQVTAMVADLERRGIDIPDSVSDLCICCSTMMYVRKLQPVLTEASRITKPDKYFGFNLFVHKEPGLSLKTYSGKPMYHVHSFKRVQEVCKMHGFKEVAVEILSERNFEDYPVYNMLFLMQKIYQTGVT